MPLRRSTLIVCACALFLAGCGNKLQTAYAVRSTVNAALEESIKLHDAGVIDDQELAVVGRLGREAEPILDELDRAALADDAFRWQVVLDAARKHVDEILRWLARIRSRQ